MKTKIGLKDRDGRDICEGDIVEFRVEYDCLERPTYDVGTLMRDRVEIIDGKAYFMCPENGCGASAWRHNEHCRIISR